MNPLHEVIAKQIARQGVVSFEKFMDLALYCPELGYYERQQDTVGQRGDFYTSVSVGSVFGELLGFQFADWLTAIAGNSGGPLHLVEAGAHDGRLAGDLLNYFRIFHPDIFHRLEYWILEPSPVRRQWQEATLAAFAPHVRWARDWADFPATGVRGIIFANELLDAFPVRRLGWNAAEKSFFEWGVTLRDSNFVWAKMPLQNKAEMSASSSAANHSTTVENLLGMKLPGDLLDVLPDGFTTEICPAASAWWQQAARALRSGRLLALDYGLEAEDFFRPERVEGTLRAYRQHRLVTNLLDAPGEQDLTAHVNFTPIRRVGEAGGLKTDACEPQSAFLVRVAGNTECPAAAFEKWTPPRVRQFQTLTHPQHLGRSFRVLLQSR